MAPRWAHANQSRGDSADGIHRRIGDKGEDLGLPKRTCHDHSGPYRENKGHSGVKGGAVRMEMGCKAAREAL